MQNLWVNLQALGDWATLSLYFASKHFEITKKKTIWFFNVAMERSTIFKFGKPSISMGHLYHSYVSHNQRVWHWWALKILQLQVLASPCFITTVQIMWGPGYPHHTVTEPLIFPRDNQVFLQHKNGYHMILHKSHGLQKKVWVCKKRESGRWKETWWETEYMYPLVSSHMASRKIPQTGHVSSIVFAIETSI